ncbi:hypothetical protein DFJ66_2517 [Saccharothrix variisporea]|uniref:Uncharacterized protein n=2 Tax=Saccharothrix variisporea TaxID=543527 RepID=A0A495X6Y8_9PSEU|nr:hypothetical protein DFJ66_2517 [Saccharothrix variisporea]
MSIGSLQVVRLSAGVLVSFGSDGRFVVFGRSEGLPFPVVDGEVLDGLVVPDGGVVPDGLVVPSGPLTVGVSGAPGVLEGVVVPGLLGLSALRPSLPS